MPDQNIQLGLYDPAFEHDACGIGFVANIKGNKSHQNISDALNHFGKYGTSWCLWL